MYDREFVVVGRCASSVIFAEEEHIIINASIGDRTIRYLFGTHMAKSNKGDEAKGIYFECYAKASSVADAVETFTNSANVLLSVQALDANAYIGHTAYEVAFEVTDGVREREFFQSLFPGETVMWSIQRKFPKDAIVELIVSIMTHKYTGLLLTAISHYRDMLSNWNTDERLRCVTQLFVSVEALGEIVAKQEMDRTGRTKKEVAACMGIDVHRDWNNHFMGKLKQIYIFHGDMNTYQKAKSISDGFEHAFRSFDSMRQDAHEVVVRAAMHVRKAIIELSDVSETSKLILLGEPYSRPKGPIRIVHYIFGKLVGDGPELAAPDQAYPILSWKYRREQTASEGSGGSRLAIDISPRVVQGIALRLERYEAWDGASIADSHEVGAMLRGAESVAIEVTAKVEPTITGVFAENAPGTSHFLTSVGWFVTNFASVRFMLLAAEHAVGATPATHARNRSVKSIIRDLRRNIILAEQNNMGELLMLLKEAICVYDAYRVATEGMMLLGWNGEPTGMPKEIAMVTRSSRDNKKITRLGKAELDEFSLRAATLASGLQRWLKELEETSSDRS